MSTRIHTVVPDGLLKLIDADRGDVPRSRWLVRAAEAYLTNKAEKRDPEYSQNVSDYTQRARDQVATVEERAKAHAKRQAGRESAQEIPLPKFAPRRQF